MTKENTFQKIFEALSRINEDFKSNIQTNKLLLQNQERADLINSVGGSLDILQAEMQKLALISDNFRDYDC